MTRVGKRQAGAGLGRAVVPLNVWVPPAYRRIRNSRPALAAPSTLPLWNESRGVIWRASGCCFEGTKRAARSPVREVAGRTMGDEGREVAGRRPG
jgi:hypothetical protein